MLDTNVVSELRKPQRDPQVLAWVDAQQPLSLFLSVVTLAEIRYGIELLASDDLRRSRLELWLAEDLRPWFADRLFGIDEDVLVTGRRLAGRSRALRVAFLQPDLFIAATALHHDLCVVTRNVSDFIAAGVPVLNPWTDTEPRPPAN